jgi:hypothetical protein
MKEKIMSTFMLEFGDPYADGHGQSEEIHVEVLGYSGDDLRANFKINEKELGIDVSTFAADYQDSRVTYEELLPLLEDGFEFGENTELGIGNEELEEAEEIYIGSDAFTDILMYLYGRGLANFSWRVIEKPERLNSHGNYGYGMFGF